jgi:flagellar biosynthesis protein FlhB
MSGGGGEDGGEKTHEPSQKRLDDARRDGNVARSPDLVAGVAALGFAATLALYGARAVEQTGGALLSFWRDADRLALRVFDAGADLDPASGGPLFARAFAAIMPLWPFVLVPALLALAMIWVSGQGRPAASKLIPKLDRISPAKLAGQKFGLDGLADFARAFAKLILVSTALVLFLQAGLDRLLALMAAEGASGFAGTGSMVRDFLLVAATLAVVLGGLDFLWQHFAHRRRLRMSRQELVDEAKDAEGDPHVKAARQQKAREVATNRMLADVADADVVIVNPTHYAVALRWDRASGSAPVCVAKGVDEIAARIRERAAAARVPIHSDPPTARAIHAGVAIGAEIRPEQYRAVAVAIRFAERLRRRAGTASGAAGPPPGGRQ